MEKLSLIDVSSEDDLLISSSADCRRDPRSSGLAENHEEHNCFVLEPASAHERENLLKLNQQWVHVPEMSESPEQKMEKSGKVNLRKSLAWDMAFFTSEGVLNTEELATVNSTYRKTEVCLLPGIQEELRRSSESTSTLDSESYTLESLEGDLFENVRASIQKSLGNRDDCSSGLPTAPCLVARKTIEITAQTKMKPPVTVKRDGVNRQQLECSSKESLLGGKEVAKRSGDSKILLKPPRIVPKPTTLPSVPSKKNVSGSVLLKNNSRRTSSGSDDNRQGVVAFRKTNGDSSNMTSRSISSLKPNPGPHQGTVLFSTASCLSNGGHLSHTAACKSPLEPTRKRSAARNSDQYLPGSTTKTPARALKSKLGPSTLGHPPTHVKPTYKFPSRASPSSSIDSVISEASSSTSTSIKPGSSVESLASSTSLSRSLAVYTDAEASPSADTHTVSADQPCIRREISANLLQSRSIAKSSVGTRVSSEPSNSGHARNSIKINAAPKSFRPSGLRMPSPKIGYFDAEKTLVSNPNKISQSGIRNGSLRGNCGASDTVGGNKPKSSKIPSMRPAAQNVSVNLHAPQAQSASLSPQCTIRASPLSMRRQSQPSHENKNPSPATSDGYHSMVCKRAVKVADGDKHSSGVTHKGSQATDHFNKRENRVQLTCGDDQHDEHMTNRLHSVSITFEAENLFPAHETKGLIPHSPNEFQKISPVGIMDKMSLLSLSEATDFVGGD